MSAHVLVNLLNKMRKIRKFKAFLAFYHLFTKSLTNSMIQEQEYSTIVLG